jgi:Amt family ammonium transporter
MVWAVLSALSWQRFLHQAIGVVATLVYTAVATYIILKVVDMITGLRVSAEEEQQSLDLILHDEKGYDL